MRPSSRDGDPESPASREEPADPVDDLAAPVSPDRVDGMIGDARPSKAAREAIQSRTVRLVHYEEIERREFAKGPPVGSMGLDARIAAHLEKEMASLYAYQAEAIGLILGGHSIAIDAPTAAGKTVAFLAPVLSAISRSGERGIKAIFVYPTKALARDQKLKIDEMASIVGASVEMFVGYINDKEGERIVKNLPDILVTNFDHLHYQLCRHKHLKAHLRSIQFLVVDEAHTYTGVFGSNVHHVIARLKRFNRDMQCIAASATLGRSEKFCSELFGQEMITVSEKSRHSTFDFAIMAPLMDRTRHDRRVQRNELIVKIAGIMHGEGGKTILFSNSHRNAEMVYAMATRKGLPVEIHRAGLPARHLRGVEQRLRTGEARIVSCTPTLELGLDIGGVNTVVSEIVPSNRFVQRIGRAGRAGDRGCAFLVLGHDPISQYYRNHPLDYMRDGRGPQTNPKHPLSEDIHTVAMAMDSPLGPEEASGRPDAVKRCLDRGLLKSVGGMLMPTKAGDGVLFDHNIRGTTDSVALVVGKDWITERARPAALSELHPGAVYMHRGESYRVTSLDDQHDRADAVRMEPNDSKYTTATTEKHIDNVDPISTGRCLDTDIQYCRLTITVTVARYTEKDYANPAHVKRLGLDPHIKHTFETHGVRIWPRHLEDPAGKLAQEWALHAIEHAIIGAACMVVGATHSDLGSANQNGMVYVYDNIGGENGSSRAMHDRMEDIIVRARDILAGCDCAEDIKGCMHCTFSYSCGRGNNGLYKEGARELLQRMVDAGKAGVGVARG